ncbi:MAG: hypothetical protein KF752_08980 [Pirellulaceae bacterium]|nr:hypothetical protein [Pirellulaceae bacterium]
MTRVSHGLYCIVSLLYVGAARADIFAVSTTMTVVTPPVSVVGEGILESSTTMYIIDEGISIVPPGPPLFVNAFGPGPHGGSFPPSLMLPPGAIFHSYLVHFDPAPGIVSLTGSVTFDPGETIHGIQTYSPLLYSTDGPFGNALVTYPGVFIATRGFDTLPAPSDMVTIAGDLNSATFSLTAELGMDQARIFTIPVPEISSCAMLVVAMGLSSLRRRNLNILADYVVT